MKGWYSRTNLQGSFRNGLFDERGGSSEENMFCVFFMFWCNIRFLWTFGVHDILWGFYMKARQANLVIKHYASWTARIGGLLDAHSNFKSMVEKIIPYPNAQCIWYNLHVTQKTAQHVGKHAMHWASGILTPHVWDSMIPRVLCNVKYH